MTDDERQKQVQAILNALNPAGQVTHTPTATDAKATREAEIMKKSPGSWTVDERKIISDSCQAVLKDLGW